MFSGLRFLVRDRVSSSGFPGPDSRITTREDESRNSITDQKTEAWKRILLAGGLVILCFAAAVARAEEPPAPEAPPPESNLARALIEGAEAAIRGEKAKALDRLQSAALIAPEHPGVQESLGAAALLIGDRLRAKRVLERTPSMAVYWAMAEYDGPGGLSRATTVLSRHLKTEADRALPGALFLAALAFWRSGQEDRAHELLERAMKKSSSALDESFAPDPAVGLARSVLVAIDGIPSAARQAKEARVRLATALFEAERRGEAVRLAEAALDDEATRAAGLRVLVLAENASQARRALERIDRVIAEEPDATDAKIARVVLLVRLGELDRAQKLYETLPPVDSKELRAEALRARAAIVLHKGDAAEALEAAEAAVRAEPKSDAAVALLVRALLANKKNDRAEAFAAALLKHAPREVDPFELMALVAEAKGSKKKASELRLRSQGFQLEKAKLERAVNAREEVLRAVRDAEGGIGAVGLEALRGEYPSISLPADIGLARGATAGFARAARARILNSCAPHLPRLLGRLTGWDRTTIAVSLYGTVENVSAPLSGADPARCQK